MQRANIKHMVTKKKRSEGTPSNISIVDGTTKQVELLRSLSSPATCYTRCHVMFGENRKSQKKGRGTPAYNRAPSIFGKTASQTKRDIYIQLGTLNAAAVRRVEQDGDEPATSGRRFLAMVRVQGWYTNHIFHLTPERTR